ncbi:MULTISPECIES: lycopene cyclase domain-containing protein [unclassified Frigoribacterium]|uniref:lycopene cyclase domain-containing protein n=1 Tax=unclassified Frigoribacterium TaxID=2627005 RepID=UPI0006F2AF27|nr:MULTISPECIES: lycopene cyclase domain-containing protein [unclassified Frigoribacterium]KQM23575.1 C50 carotenoid epsilon cyclase [Frigoribacterium sp. Leaf8]MBD8486763.1 lycopene cyclase domain-containing protein [Frigoribacterium sp. CFBP 8759]ROS53636.1 lycopene cyclase domain-containing protein [Frigoribacterium sp. PhB118]WAC51777.1 lycopene cyclase domain-containing protein [Frigoribacterium sp. SL97]
MGFVYLAALLVSLFGMVMLDRRFRLFFWRDVPRAAVTLLVGVVFFLVWDVVGIDLGIFFRGETSFMTGVLVATELPLEEVFFLTLLCYLTMNLLAAARMAAAVVLDRRGASSTQSGRPVDGVAS